MRRAAKRDKAEPDIVAALRAVGAYVAPISQPGLPDLFVLFRQRWYALEVKTGKGRPRSWQIAQQKFLQLTQTPIVRTPRDALIAIGAIEGAVTPTGETTSGTLPGSSSAPSLGSVAWWE